LGLPAEPSSHRPRNSRPAYGGTAEAISRGRASAALLGRLPPRSAIDRILAGTSRPAPRPHPRHSRRRWPLSDRAIGAVNSSVDSGFPDATRAGLAVPRGVSRVHDQARVADDPFKIISRVV